LALVFRKTKSGLWFVEEVSKVNPAKSHGNFEEYQKTVEFREQLSMA
jgi:hypothetical protein